MCMNEQQKKFLNSGELGDILGVTRNTVNRWSRVGKIPRIVLPNGRSVYDVDAVLATLKKQLRRPTLLRGLRDE